MDNGITLCDTDDGCHYKAEKASPDNPIWGVEALKAKIARGVGAA